MHVRVVAVLAAIGLAATGYLATTDPAAAPSSVVSATARSTGTTPAGAASPGSGPAGANGAPAAFGLSGTLTVAPRQAQAGQVPRVYPKTNPCPASHPIPMSRTASSLDVAVWAIDLVMCTDTGGAQGYVRNRGTKAAIWVLDQPAGLTWSQSSTDPQQVLFRTLLPQMAPGLTGLALEPGVAATFPMPTSGVLLSVSPELTASWQVLSLVVDEAQVRTVAQAQTWISRQGPGWRVAAQCAVSGYDIAGSLDEFSRTPAGDLLTQLGLTTQVTTQANACLDAVREAESAPRPVGELPAPTLRALRTQAAVMARESSAENAALTWTMKILRQAAQAR